MKDIFESEVISWNAPIVPSVSLGGIYLGVDIDHLENLLLNYAGDELKCLYKFDGSPTLKLTRNISNGKGVYLFDVYDVDLTNWRLFFESPSHPAIDTRALAIIFRDGKIHALKIWDFEKSKEGEFSKNVYQGRLLEGIGLGNYVSDFLKFTSLEYDDAEEWFYTKREYGGLEVTGYGDLEKYPDQPIMALTVIG